MVVIIPERADYARGKILEAMLSLGCCVPSEETEATQNFNAAYMEFVTGQSEIADLRMAFARLRQSAYALAREEWKEDLKGV